MKVLYLTQKRTMPIPYVALQAQQGTVQKASK